jgi:hypothetical protein
MKQLIQSLIISLGIIPTMASQPINPNAGKAIATYQIGSNDAQLEQGLGSDGKDVLLQVNFYRNHPSIPQAEKVCREFLARAIKQFGSKEIIVFAWFGSRKGIPKSDFEEIMLYKSLGIKPREHGKYASYRHLMYSNGVIKVD